MSLRTIGTSLGFIASITAIVACSDADADLSGPATWKIALGHHPRFASGAHNFDNRTCLNTHFFIISGAGSEIRESRQPALDNQLYYKDDIKGLAYLKSVDNVLSFQFIDQNGAVPFEKTITT